MRIIKNEPEKEMLCPTCGCEFAYMEKDVGHVGYYHDFRVVYCPNCNERISEEAGYAMDSMGGIAKSRTYRR